MKEFILVSKLAKGVDKYGNEIVEKCRHYLFVVNKEEYYLKEREVGKRGSGSESKKV